MNFRKILAVLLALVMVLGTMSTVAFATGTSKQITSTTSLDNLTDNTSYVIDGTNFKEHNSQALSVKKDTTLTGVSIEATNMTAKNGLIYIGGYSTLTLKDCTITVKNSSELEKIFAYTDGDTTKATLVLDNSKIVAEGVQRGFLGINVIAKNGSEISLTDLTAHAFRNTGVTLDSSKLMVDGAETLFKNSDDWETKEIGIINSEVVAKNLTAEEPIVADVYCTPTSTFTMNDKDIKDELGSYVAAVDDVYYTSITDAIAEIADGSNVTIFGGTYDEVLEITEMNVEVIANGKVTFTKAPSLKGQDWYIEGVNFKYENDGGTYTHVPVFNCDGTLKNCTFISTGHTLRWGYGDSQNEEQVLTIEGCKFVVGNPDSHWAIHFDSTYGADIIIKNSEFDGRVAIAGDHKIMTVSGSKFTGRYVNTYNDVTYENCTFDVNYIYTGGEDVVVNFNNCETVDEKEIVDILYDKTSGVFVDRELATNGFVAGDVKYGRLQDAIDAVNGNGTIVLTGDVYGTATVSAPQSTMALRNAPAVTIDLAGHTLNGSLMVLEGANVNIINGTIINTNKNVSAVETLGNTTFTNVNITSKRHAVRVDKSGTAVIDGGIYKLNNTENMSIYTVNASANAVVTIKDGTFIGDGGLNEASAAVSSRDNAVVTIHGGTYSNGVPNTLTGAAKENIVVCGGSYDQDPTAYLELGKGYVAVLNPVTDYYEVGAEDAFANSIAVKFVKADVDEYGDDTLEGEDVYNIVLEATSDINEFASAELTFENTSKLLNGEAMPYVIEAADNMTLSTKQGKPGYYGFSMEGDTEYEISGKTITLGKVTFEGYGTVDFGVTSGIVNATTVMNNLVKTFEVNGEESGDVTKGKLVIGENSEIEGVTIAVPVRDLTINIDFPNAVANQSKAYQDMKVVISGGDLKENIEIELGKDASEELKLAGKKDAAITVKYEDNAYAVNVVKALKLNNAYTVTVSGAGYRTARYTVTMTNDKQLNFWNNVMDEETAVEKGVYEETKNFLAGDIVKDNNINIYDLSAVVAYFGTEGINTDAVSDYAKYDLNRDGVIDSRDVAYVLVSWGE